MVGKYHIIVDAGDIVYEFDIERKYNIICGDSSTGKTTLYSLVSSSRNDDLIKVSCVRDNGDVSDLLALPNRRTAYEEMLNGSSGYVYIIDEDLEGLSSRRFANYLKSSDNYFIIITRSKLKCIPLSIEALFVINTVNGYDSERGDYTYNTLVQRFVENDFEPFDMDILLTEDSKSGNVFYKNVLECTCESTFGASGVVDKLKSVINSQDCNYSNIGVVVDGSGFGFYIEETLEYMKKCNEIIKLMTPESFEYMILKSNIFDSRGLDMDRLYDVCDRRTFGTITNNFVVAECSYDTWEQFCSAYLMYITDRTPYKYRKKCKYLADIYYKAWDFIKRYLLVIK